MSGDRLQDHSTDPLVYSRITSCCFFPKHFYLHSVNRRDGGDKMFLT